MKPSYPTGWFPLPTQSLILLLVWLLLNNSLAPGHLLLGALLAWLIPLLVAPLQSIQPGMRHPWRALRYLLVVLMDIIVANFEVARRVLGPLHRLRPAFVAVPLDIEGDLPLTLLANTVSLTPGTVSAELSKDRRWLYIHALHLEDESAMIAHIKQRYEQPLREIFQC